MIDSFERSLTALVQGLHTILSTDLVSVTLFGSAAEQRQRAVSDTNLAVVVRNLDPAKAASIREVTALAGIALRLRLLLLRDDELPAAAAAFAVKVSDIQRRHRVIFGSDPFAAVQVPRDAAIAQLRQALLSLILRMREQWLMSRNDGQVVLAAANVAGGLRACAAELLYLERTPAPTGRAALETIAGGALPDLSAAREGKLPVGGGEDLMIRLLALAETMRGRAGSLT